MSPPSRYYKRKAIGRGSFGLVFLVNAENSTELLVLKEIRLAGLSVADRQAAGNEVHVLRRLKHRNIVQYYDSFNDKSENLCIVMEFCHGGDLGGLISERKKTVKLFSGEEVLAIMSGLIQALAYCHHELILLHRDLKPQNVFLKRKVSQNNPIDSSQIKLGDFGISKVLAASQAFAKTQCGTPLYMSPEMCRGEAYDKASDVWGLGCIMYELMTLHAPHVRQLGRAGLSGGIKSLMKHISNTGLHIDRSLATHYNPELCALLKALVAPDAKNRPSLRSITSWPLFQQVSVSTAIDQAVEYDIEAAMPLSTHEAAADKIMRSFRRSTENKDARTLKEDRYDSIIDNESANHLPANRPVKAVRAQRKAAPTRNSNSRSQALNLASPSCQYDSQVAPFEQKKQAPQSHQIPTAQEQAAANQIAGSFRRSQARVQRRKIHDMKDASKPALIAAVDQYRAAKAALRDARIGADAQQCSSPKHNGVSGELLKQQHLQIHRYTTFQRSPRRNSRTPES